MKIARLHGIVLFFVAFAIPAASYLDGSGRLAYSMFADIAESRIEIRGEDAAERAFPIAATKVATALTGAARTAMVGADHFHTGPVHRMMRMHLDDLAGAACLVEPTARFVTVRLVERHDVLATTQTFESRRRPCSR
ncbi:MAG: hypothetical protein IPG50_21515 [Myxococcales bacterium]|nr:hypothetical protein [Myxococcales bacterium]